MKLVHILSARKTFFAHVMFDLVSMFLNTVDVDVINLAFFMHVISGAILKSPPITKLLCQGHHSNSFPHYRNIP